MAQEVKWEFRKRRPAVRTLDDFVKASTGMTTAELTLQDDRLPVDGMGEMASFLTGWMDAHPHGPVTIVGDYDADGITSSSILWLLFQMAFGVVPEVHLPHRFTEGYGLSMKIIDRIHDGLVVTVDNGIVAVDQIAAAKAKGLDVAVIDHHLPRPDGMLPPADALVDPHVHPEKSPFTDYCAAGLAFLLAEQLLESHDPRLPYLAAFAGIGTVADVMPLKGPNRAIVRASFDAVERRLVTDGLKAVLDELKVSRPTADDYGFRLGPLFNAAGRLLDDGAEQVFRLVTAMTSEDAWEGADQADALHEAAHALTELNRQRQDLTEVLTGRAVRHVEAMSSCLGRLPNVLVVYDPDGQEGLNGLVASHLAERFGRPVLVFSDHGKDADGILKGSGRTWDGVNLKALLDQAADCFLGYGGHAGAAGMSLTRGGLVRCARALDAALADHGFPEDSNVVWYDIEIDRRQVPAMLARLRELEPFGEGNPAPVFRVQDFPLVPKNGSFWSVMGRKEDHLKLNGQDGLTAVGFHMARQYQDDGQPRRLDVVCTLAENTFRGVSEPQLLMEAYRAYPVKKTDAFQSLESLLSFT